MTSQTNASSEPNWAWRAGLYAALACTAAGLIYFLVILCGSPHRAVLLPSAGVVSSYLAG